MDLFELLFIALFVLFPILEGVLRRKKQPGPPEPESEDVDVTMEREPRAGGGPRHEVPDREPAADMVPDDLWAVLTGEERPARQPQEAPVALEQDPTATETAEDVWETAPDPLLWEDAADAETTLEPSWLEYERAEPEALDSYEPTVVSLEKAPPAPDVRHRRFHEMIDDTAPRRPRRKRTGVGRALRGPASLRQAVVLSEVLGPPKGLE